MKGCSGRNGLQFTLSRNKMQAGSGGFSYDSSDGMGTKCMMLQIAVDSNSSQVV